MKPINLGSPPFTYDADDPEGFRSGMFRPGSELGAKATGTTVYEVPPGQAVCPYHYEYAEEEWALVLEGEVTLRTPDGTQQLGPMDLVFFPTGPEGAHQLRNDSDATVRVMMWSDLHRIAATVYPDSDKIGVWTGNDDDDVMVRRSSAVGYYDGEAEE